MAEDKKPAASPRVKRRVKPAETVREKRDKQRRIAEQPKKQRFAKAKSLLARPFRWIGSWSLWQSKFWVPFRFVGRLISRIFFFSYFKNSFQELKKVTWPGWKLSLRLTWAVLVFSIFFGVIIAIVDFGLDKLFKKLILNI